MANSICNSICWIESIALDRVYNHLLHTENFYGYFFEYAKSKEKPKPMPKEEPVVYVRDFDADKEEAQPNEKVTYKVTKYSQEKVTENDKKRIQWAIKIDGKQEVLKEKGEKLVLTIKEEWAGKEIIVMPFLVKPDEERVSKKTRVKEKLIKEIEEKKKSLSEEDWKKLRKIKGIILFSISGWSDAGGHISLWDGKNIIYVGDENNYNNPVSQKYYFHMTKYFEIKGKKDKIVQTDSIKLWELK